MRWHRILPLLLVCIAMAMTACDETEDSEGAEPPAHGGDDPAATSDSPDGPSTEDEASDEPEPPEPSGDDADTDADGGSDGSENTTDPDAVEFPVEGPLTEAEAQAVLHEIDRLDAQALATYLDQGDITDEVIDQVNAAYDGDAALVRLQSLNDIHDGRVDVEFENPPQPRMSEFEEFVQNSDECSHIRIELSRDGKVVDPPEPSKSFAVLEPHDPHQGNHTGWALTRLYTPSDGEPGEDLCE